MSQHYILTNASPRFLAHMQSILAKCGKPIELIATNNGFTIIKPQQGEINQSILEWGGINSLSLFDFVSFFSDAEDIHDIAQKIIGEHKLEERDEETLFDSIRNNRPGQNVGGKTGYSSQFSETAAHTTKPVESDEKNVIIDTAEGYDAIFAREFDPEHYNKLGTTSYADRYNVAPPMTMRRIESAIDDIIANKEPSDKTITVFDFGAGHGRIAIPLAEYIRAKGYTPNIIAYDTSKFALDHFEARLKGSSTPYHRGGGQPPKESEFMLTSSLADIERYKGQADLSLSIAGSLHHVPDEATLKASLATIHDMLRDDGLFMGTGPTANIRYRERILSRLDMRISTEMFKDICALIPSLLDDKFKSSLHDDFITQMEQVIKENHNNINDILNKYDLKPEELSVLITELIMQERPIGHPNFMGASPYTPQWEAEEKVSEKLYPEFKGKNVFTKWTYRMEIAETLSTLLSQNGFVPEYYGPDTFNHNDAAAKDPLTVQQERRLANTKEADPSQAFDYIFRAHKRELFLDKKCENSTKTQIEELLDIEQSLKNNGHHRIAAFVKDLAIALDPKLRRQAERRNSDTWDWDNLLSGINEATDAYNFVKQDTKYRASALENADKILKTCAKLLPSKEANCTRLSEEIKSYYDKTISRTIGLEGKGGITTYL